MLCDMCQTDLTHKWNLKNNQNPPLIGTEKRLVVARGGRGQF